MDAGYQTLSAMLLLLPSGEKKIFLTAHHYSETLRTDLLYEAEDLNTLILVILPFWILQQQT